MYTPDPDREEGSCTYTAKHFMPICALLGTLALILPVGVWLCISFVSFDKTKNKVLDVTIHPFQHTNHHWSLNVGEKPHIEEVKPIELTITVKEVNLTHPEKGYKSFTLTTSIKGESQKINPDMKLALEMIKTPRKILMKEGSIVEVNNSDKFGPYTGKCNKVQGSDGFLFPLPLTSKEKVYDPIAKQAVPLVWVHSTGDTAYYEPNESYLATEEYYPENACYANRQAEVEDPKDGIRFIGNNIIISQPHFLDGDPRLLDNVEGLVPDKKKHGIQYTVDTKTGETLKSRFTFQFNIQHNGTIFPLFWIEENYTRVEPFYVIHVFFYFGVVLIILGILGTLVLTGICIKRRSDKKVWIYSTVYREQQFEEIMKDNAHMNQRPVRVPLISNSSTATNSTDTTAATTAYSTLRSER